MKNKHIAIALIIIFALFVIAFGKVQAEAEKYGEWLKEQEEAYEKSLRELLESTETEILILESEINNLENKCKELELKNKELELELYSYWLGREAD